MRTIESLEKELVERLGYSCIESCIQKAEAWDEIVVALNEEVPAWHHTHAYDNTPIVSLAIKEITKLAKFKRKVKKLLSKS